MVTKLKDVITGLKMAKATKVTTERMHQNSPLQCLHVPALIPAPKVSPRHLNVTNQVNRVLISKWDATPSPCARLGIF